MNLSEKMKPVKMKAAFELENKYVWGASVVKGQDGKYHMFADVWDKTVPFHPGWLVVSRIVEAVSETPEGPYKYERTLFEQRGNMYWDGMSVFNPHVIKHNGKYVMFYTGTTYPFSKKYVHENLDDASRVARSNKRIGIAVCDTPGGTWKRFDKPAIDISLTGFDNFLTTNAAPCVMENGDILVVFKTRGYLEDNGEMIDLHSDMQFNSCILDKDTYEVKYRGDKPLFGDVSLEDPFIWLENNKYYMIAKDMTGNVCGERQSGIFAESDDGLEWKLHYGEKSYVRTIKYEDGSEKTLGNMERPFILFDNGKMTDIYFASSDGNGHGFDGMTRSFNMCIELK